MARHLLEERKLQGRLRHFIASVLTCVAAVMTIGVARAPTAADSPTTSRPVDVALHRFDIVPREGSTELALLDHGARVGWGSRRKLDA